MRTCDNTLGANPLNRSYIVGLGTRTVRAPLHNSRYSHLGEVVPAELIVQPRLGDLPLDNQTRVVIYRAGTQTQVAASDPGPEHRFHLDPGDYDAYVENRYGKGQPYKLDHGIHLGSGQTVTRKVPLDAEAKSGGQIMELPGTAPTR